MSTREEVRDLRVKLRIARAEIRQLETRYKSRKRGMLAGDDERKAICNAMLQANRCLQRLVQAEAKMANGSVEFAEDSNARS